MKKTRLAGVALALLLAVSVAGSERDRDRDGVSDTVERALIERFRPRFHVSARDCAELPAEFHAFSAEPRVKDRNATLYARVSPSTALGADVEALELHYYHLWERDCGPLNAHRLDVEHVSTLVVSGASMATSPTSSSGWRFCVLVCGGA